MRDRIAVITMGVKLGYEKKGYTRFLTICEMLSKRGMKVDLITSLFQHWDKAHRDRESFPYDMYDFNIIFIDEPGYKKNVDLKRINSHSKAALNLKKHLNSHDDYGLVYCEIPPNDVALEAARYAEREHIPFIADINDLWPEAMRMVVDIPVVSDIAFHGLAHDGREVYKRLSAVVGTSDEYANRPFSDCKPDIEKLTVYVGNDLAEFDEGVKNESSGIDKPSGEFWVSYAGTLGASYDIKTLITAASILHGRGYDDIRIVLLGDGPDKEKLMGLADELDCNVTFAGYAPYPKMAAYLSKSDIVVNSLVKKAPQSIVTKIGDYLASGHPMINTGSSKEFSDKTAHDGFGITIEAENATLMADTIELLYKDRKLCKLMGQRARDVAEKEFDRACSYNRICDLICKMMDENVHPDLDD